MSVRASDLRRILTSGVKVVLGIINSNFVGSAAREVDLCRSHCCNIWTRSREKRVESFLLLIVRVHGTLRSTLNTTISRSHKNTDTTESQLHPLVTLTLDVTTR